MKIKLWRVKTHLIAKEVFQYSLTAYLILLLAETIKEGFVSFFFDPNIVLTVVLICGIVMLITHQEKFDEHIHHEKEDKVKKRDILFTIILALGGAFLVLYKTIDLGMLAILIAGLTVLIIALSAFLVLTEAK